MSTTEEENTTTTKKKTTRKRKSRAKVKNGQPVSVHYVGTFDDGTQFDSSREREEPISFTIGAGQMIPGFDRAVEGMKIGEKKSVSLPPEEAYGVVNPKAIQEVKKEAFPADFDPVEGQTVYGQTQEGHNFQAKVLSLHEQTVTLDFNHPMAGKNLNFEIELVDVGE